MPGTHHLTAYPGQFSEVVFPNPRERLWPGRWAHLQHRLICCDCGLAHDFEFRIVRTAVRGRTVGAIGAAPKDKFAVQFRVRRNERSTAQQRRRRKQRVKVKKRPATRA